jgi:hypothetical protein
MHVFDIHWAFAFAFVAISALSQAARASDECFCLENFEEARFLYNCRTKSVATPTTALCTSAKHGVSEIAMGPKWTKLAAQSSNQCPKDCQPRQSGDRDYPRGE